MIKNIQFTFQNVSKLFDSIIKIVKISDGNLRKFFKAISYSLVNLIFDLLSLGALFPLIYLILEKKNFFEKFSFLQKFDFINNLSENNLIYFFILVVLFLIIIKFFVSLGFNNFIWKYCYSIEREIEKNVFKIILDKKYSFFTKNPLGNLISLTKEESVRCMEVVRSFIFGLVEAIALILIILALLIAFPATSVLILFMLTLFSFIFILIIRIRTSGISKIRSNLHKFLFKAINESFTAIKEIKFNNLHNQINKNFNILNSDLTKIDAKSMSIVALPKVFFEFLLLLSALLILFTFMIVDLDESTMVSNLTIFALCAYRLFPAFSSIPVNYQQIRLKFNSLETVHKFITFADIESEIINKPTFKEIDSDTLIILDNLKFSFEDKKKMIKIYFKI